MITEEIIQKSFIRKVMARDAAFIYDTQARVIKENFKDQRTANLAAFLSSHPFSVEGGGLNLWYSFNIFTFLRLLDIKFSKQAMGMRRRIALYNRVVWGRLYHETLGDLKYGLTQEIKEQITKQLSQTE